MKKNSFISKRLFAQILALVILVASLSCAFITNATAETSAIDQSLLWDGKANTQPQGSGTQEEPYLISNGAELRWLNWSAGQAMYDAAPAYYKLTADIYLNDVSDPNWMNNSPNAFSVYQYSRFQGEIDGNGHTIYGLYIDNNTATGRAVGLVGTVLNDTTFKNLGIKNSYVSATGASNKVGVIAGTHAARNGATSGTVTFENCFIDETVTVKGSTSGANSFTGGFIGAGYGHSQGWSGWTSENWKQIFRNCYYIGNENTLSGYDKCFAFTGAGGGEGGIYIYDSYCISNVRPLHAGRIYDVYGNVAYTDFDQRTINVLTADEMISRDAQINMPDLDWETTWQTTVTYPTLIKFGVFNWDNYIDPDLIWDGKANTQPQGSGTQEEPYLISNGAELRWLNWSASQEMYDAAPAYYKLTADIYLNDVSDPDWMNNSPKAFSVYPNSRFQGEIDGNGHTIYGLYIDNNTATGRAVGLVGTVLNDTTFKNLGIKNSYVSATGASNKVGVIAGTHAARNGATSGTVTFENCFIDETVTVKGSTSGANSFTGGFIGAGYGHPEGWNGFVSDDWKQIFRNCYYIGNENTLSGYDKCFAFTGAGGSAGGIYIYDSYCISNVRPLHAGKIYDVYGTVAYTDYDQRTITVLTDDQMKGKTARTNMPDLDWIRVWETTETYPTLRVFTGNIIDVNGDKITDINDLTALRNHLLDIEIYSSTDVNADGDTNICDLVYLSAGLN